MFTVRTCAVSETGGQGGNSVKNCRAEPSVTHGPVVKFKVIDQASTRLLYI